MVSALLANAAATSDDAGAIFLILAIVTGFIASSKNRSGFWWFVGGALFGPIAFIFVLFASKLPRRT